ncbi:MAG: phosphopantetheine-binding protein, partial [Acidobacteriota bacterium]|nr:phosphopantetheine-binding protein [Acidobacteriota bacterium]
SRLGPGPVRSRREEAYAPPRTPLEAELARLWAEVLGIDKVGVGDNFFALGGDSLLGVQLIGRAGEQGIALAPRHLFERPTVAGLAALAGTLAAPPAGRFPEAG